ncbi:MAG: hypothetical protein AB1489_15130 [Acidobacteriota bacterium]
MAKKKQKEKGKKERQIERSNSKPTAETVILPTADYTLVQDGALYSEIVVHTHIRISNDQVRRSSYDIEMRVDPALSDEIPETWGMIKFTEVLPEAGNDGGPGELFLTRPVATTDMNGSYLRFQLEDVAAVPERNDMNAASFLNSRIEKAISEVIKLHQSLLATRQCEQNKRRTTKLARRAVVRKGP